MHTGSAYHDFKNQSTEDIEMQKIKTHLQMSRIEKQRRDRLFRDIKAKKKHIESGGDVWQRIQYMTEEESQRELFKAALESGNV